MRSSSWRTALASELAPRVLLSSASAALVLYLLVAILSLSMTALIYAGPLAPLLPQALGGALVGTALLCAIVAAFGSYGGAIAPTQDSTAVILALGAASVAATLPAAPRQTLLATVGALVALTTIAMAIVYALLARFRLGTLVRFVPYPVMGGFLAGTGWLLVTGGIGVASGAPFDMRLLEPALVARWLPAALLGLAMLLAVQRWGNAALVAALAALATAAFYAVMWALGRPPSSLAADGWLLGPFPDELQWRFALAPDALAQVDRAALAQALPAAAPALLIGALSLLLNASALELVVKRDLALDRDLYAHAAANAATALGGGAIGYTAISMSTLNHALAGGRRMPALLVAAMLLLTALLGTALVAAVPRLVMAALPIFIGAALLHEWLLQSRRNLPRSEYAIVVAIFAVIAVQDFLWGVALGLVATTLLFVVEYSRIAVVRRELVGDAARSRLRSAPRERDRLLPAPGRLAVLQLHGFLFFGTAQRLYEMVRQRLGEGGAPRYLVLDFALVSGLDSTALTRFGKLVQDAAAHDAVLVLATLPARVAAQFDADAALAALPRFADADRAVEWCEQRLLDEARPPDAGLREQLLVLLPEPERIDALLARLERRTVAAGERLIAAGDAADAIYFVESGRLTAQLPRADGREALRLESSLPGASLGELGFVLGTPRSADVVADTDSTVLELTRARWRQLVEREPEVARTLDALLLQVLGERTMHLTKVVDALQR